MVAIAFLFVRMVWDCFKSRRRLEAEILVLRHQLNVLQQRAPRRLRLRWTDRPVHLALSSLSSRSDVKDRKLVANEPEASIVRLIFKRYAELGSVALVKAELDRLGIVSKRRESADGRLAGGQHFSRGALYMMLQNRIYRGEIVHQGEAYPGQHEAILDPELWQIVQDKLTANRQERALAVGAEAPSLLAGLIVDSDGSRMTPTHATKKAKRHRYYISAPLLADDRSQAQKGMRLPAGDLEGLVLERL